MAIVALASTACGSSTRATNAGVGKNAAASGSNDAATLTTSAQAGTPTCGITAAQVTAIAGVTLHLEPSEGETCGVFADASFGSTASDTPPSFDITVAANESGVTNLDTQRSNENANLVSGETVADLPGGGYLVSIPADTALQKEMHEARFYGAKTGALWVVRTSLYDPKRSFGVTDLKTITIKLADLVRSTG